LKNWTTLEVMVQGGAIIVTLPSSRFRAVYYKPHGQPQLILRERTKTDDYDLLSEDGRQRATRPASWVGLYDQPSPVAGSYFPGPRAAPVISPTALLAALHFASRHLSGINECLDAVMWQRSTV
jgi:hypothetical protein